MKNASKVLQDSARLEDEFPKNKSTFSVCFTVFKGLVSRYYLHHRLQPLKEFFLSALILNIKRRLKTKKTLKQQHCKTLRKSHDRKIF